MAKYHIEGNGADRHIVNIDEDSPDVLLARSEPLHPDEQEDYDADLLPQDDGSDISAQGIKAIPKDALKVLLQFLLPASSISPRKRWRIGQLRLVTLCHMAGLEGVGDKTLTSLADELGCTRALLSLYAVKMTDQLKENRVRGGKSRASRQVFRESAIRVHRRLGHNVTADKQRELASP